MATECRLQRKRKHSFNAPYNSTTRFVPLPSRDVDNEEEEASSDSASSQDDNSSSSDRQLDEPSDSDSDSDGTYGSENSFESDQFRWAVAASSSTTTLDSSPPRKPQSPVAAQNAARPRSGRKGSVAKLEHLCPHAGCGKSYKRLARLTEHIRSHTGEVQNSRSSTQIVAF